MELLSFLNNSSIEDIPLLELESQLSQLKQTVRTNYLSITYNSRIKPIKCVREYYLNPLTKKKVPKVNIVNACTSIHGTFGIKDCASVDCNNCHRKMIENYFNGEAYLIKNNKK